MVIASALGVVVAFSAATWTLTRAVDGPAPALGLGTAGTTSICSTGSIELEHVTGAGPLSPSRDAELTEVRLLGASNVELIEAVAAPWVSWDDPPPVVAAPPPQWRADYLDSTAWDWSRADDIPGSLLRTGAQRELVLLLRVEDLDRDASFTDVEVAYAVDGEHGSELMEVSWRAMGGDRACPY